MRRILLTWVLLLSAAGAAQSGGDTRGRVIAADPVLERFVANGRLRSPTFRGLVERLEASDWLVYVQRGHCPDRAAVGCTLHMVGTIHGRRYLRLVLSPAALHRDQVIALIGHELQHAVEFASNDSVTDTASLKALARRISTLRLMSKNAVVYETAEANRVQGTILRELVQRTPSRR